MHCVLHGHSKPKEEQLCFSSMKRILETPKFSVFLFCEINVAIEHYLIVVTNCQHITINFTCGFSGLCCLASSSYFLSYCLDLSKPLRNSKN